MARLITIDLDAVPASIMESLRAVLHQRGLVICSAADTQYPKLDRDLDKVLREVGKNAAGAIALSDESEVAA
jgi:hypothetical protein